MGTGRSLARNLYALTRSQQCEYSCLPARRSWILCWEARPKFSAGGESEDEWIIYASPLPCLHVEAVEIHMDCYQHKCTESMASHAQEHCQILDNEIYQQPLNQLAGFDLIWGFAPIQLHTRNRPTFFPRKLFNGTNTHFVPIQKQVKLFEL
jgi:hypothetical protein